MIEKGYDGSDIGKLIGKNISYFYSFRNNSYYQSLNINIYCKYLGTNSLQHSNSIDNDAEETQEHLEVCTGCEYERRGKKMSEWTGKVIFWRRVTAKIVAWGKGDSDELLLPGGTLT